MKRLPMILVLMALVMVVGALGGFAIADNHVDMFYACEKDGNIISGSVMFNQEPMCKGGSTLVSWNSEGPPGPQGPPGPPGGSPGEFGTCVGTYFVQRFFPGPPTGELSYHSDTFWTFSADGTFQGTSSSEHIGFSEFSHKQGAWIPTADFVANMVNLDFEFVDDTVARNDAVVTFSSDCTALTAEFSFRSYDARMGFPLGSPPSPSWIPDEDPLDPLDGSPSSSGLFASGRLLTPIP